MVLCKNTQIFQKYTLNVDNIIRYTNRSNWNSWREAGD